MFSALQIIMLEIPKPFLPTNTKLAVADVGNFLRNSERGKSCVLFDAGYQGSHKGTIREHFSK